MDISSVNFLRVSSRRTTAFKELMRSYPLQVYKRDSYLFKEGELARYIYYIESGRVLATKNYKDGQKELALGYYQAEQFINLTSLFAKQEPQQSHKSINRVTVRAIPSFEFNALMRKNPYLNQLVLNVLSKELNRQNEQYFKNITLDSKQRVITFLVDQVKQIGTRVGYEWVIREFFTQLEIAQLTNTARQTVNVTMNDLRRKKLIYFRYKYFIVRELEILERLANQ